MAEKKKNWLFTKDNILWLVTCLVLGAVIGGIVYAKNQVVEQNHQQEKQLANLNHKLDRLQAKNDRVIYLPKPGDLNLSSSQVKSVSWLTQFFNRMTTFDNRTTYRTNYDYAKEHVHDKTFFRDFLSNPTDDEGGSLIDATNIKMEAVRTQVIVTGDDSYQVIVTYVPYHASSDLYQRNKLQTMSQVFDVKGQPGDYSQMKLNDEVITNGRVVTVGSLN